MIDITCFTNEFLCAVKENFKERVWFVGLQGSYARGEATEKSDVDIVVILDELSSHDVYDYNIMLDSLPHRDKICGFLSGKKEILNWDSTDLFQFYYDTKALFGSLDELLPLIDETAVKRAIKLGVCNIYHGCVHNMLYEKNIDALLALYKSASFVVQAVAFLQMGNYVSRQADLLNSLPFEERRIIEIFADLKNGKKTSFDNSSEILFNWSKTLIEKI